jgi:hypothetical protein
MPLVMVLLKWFHIRWRGGGGGGGREGPHKDKEKNAHQIKAFQSIFLPGFRFVFLHFYVQFLY